MNAKGVFTVAKWEEKGLGGLLSQVSAQFDLCGDIGGRMTVEYLMHSVRSETSDIHDVEATYSGYLLFEGSIFDVSGSFVAEDKGIYSKKGPESFFTIKPVTGTGGLAGVSGTGKYYADGSRMILELSCSL